jgi:GAF domain-containing protein
MNVWTGIKRFFAPPVFEGDEEKTRNAALLNTLLWVVLGAIIAVSIPQILDRDATPEAKIMTAVMIYAVFVPALLGLIWMSRRGRVRQAGGLLATLIWMVTTIAIIIFGGIRSTVTPAFFVAVFIAGLLIGWRAAVGFGLLSTASMFLVLLLERSGVQIGQYTIPIHPSSGAGFDDFFMLFGIIVATTTIVGLSRRSIVSALMRAQANERALAEANRELQTRSQELQARTRDLARRSMQLQVAADISRDVIAMRELDELLNRAVNLVQDRFGFYHVALYLVDEQDEYAVLRAATEAGRQMLEQGQQVDLEEEGLISYVVNSGYHRLLFDVGDGAVSFENSLLPETRSELALPLRVGRRIIGAFDIQCRREEAFDGDDVAVLQAMADQFAVAIENAWLLSEMQQTLRQLEVASGLFTQDSWRISAQRGRQGVGYRYRRLGIERAAGPPPEAVQAWADGHSVVLTPQPDAAGDGQEPVSNLAVPVKLRDQVVGVLNLSFEDQAVSPDTVSLVEEVANRLALALENARLLDETRQRGQRDRLIADITAQVRASMDVERILQTAVRGLGAALGTERAFIKLGGAEGRSSTGTGPLAPEALDNLPDDGGQESSAGDEQVEEQATEEIGDQIAEEADEQAPEEMSD